MVIQLLKEYHELSSLLWCGDNCTTPSWGCHYHATLLGQWDEYFPIIRMEICDYSCLLCCYEQTTTHPIHFILSRSNNHHLCQALMEKHKMWYLTFDKTLSYFYTCIIRSNEFWQKLVKQQSLFQPNKPQIIILSIGVEHIFDGNHNVSKQFFKSCRPLHYFFHRRDVRVCMKQLLSNTNFTFFAYQGIW